MIAAALGGAIIGAAVEPKGVQYWVFLAVAAAIIAGWARSRKALGIGLCAVGLFGIAGAIIWSAFASVVVPIAVAVATAVRTSVGRQIVHVAVVALGSFAALLVPGALGAEPIVSVAIWGAGTAALVGASHQFGQQHPPA